MKLTEQSRQYARNRHKGMSQIDAYKKAYGEEGKSLNALQSAASRLEKRPAVQTYLQSLRDKSEVKAIVTRDKILEFFTTIMTDDEQRVADRMKAAEVICKMEGYNEPEKVEATISVIGSVISKLKDQRIQYKKR